MPLPLDFDKLESLLPDSLFDNASYAGKDLVTKVEFLVSAFRFSEYMVETYEKMLAEQKEGIAEIMKQLAELKVQS